MPINITYQPTKRCYVMVTSVVKQILDGSSSRIMRLVAHSALWCNNKYDATGSRHPCRNPSLPPGSSNYAAITSIINNRYPTPLSEYPNSQNFREAAHYVPRAIGAKLSNDGRKEINKHVQNKMNERILFELLLNTETDEGK